MTGPQPLLSVERLSISFDGVRALQDVALTIPHRQIAGLIGPNGSGKTTLFNCVSGYYRSSGGRILFDGRDITHSRPHTVARMGAGRTFQTPNLFAEMTVRENLMLAVENKARNGSTLRGLLPAHDRADAARFVGELLNRLGLDSYADVMPVELPVGIAKLGDLGRALATRPKLLLLDEPAVGLNDNERQKLIGLLADLNTADGLTMLIVDHNMNFVTSLCTNITVLASGCVIGRGPPAVIRSDPAVIQAYLGEEAHAGA
jgi:branched-chain amino acid transport system permease protein